MLSAGAQAQVTVSSRQPVRNAVAAPRNSAITVGFSQAISAASATNLRVYSAQLRGKLASNISGGGTAALTFTPSQGFAAGEVLSVSLPPTLLSTGGTALTRHVYQFTAATSGFGRGFFVDTTVVGNTGNRDQVLGDLDNDGDLDLVTTGALYGCRIFLNNGTGHYAFLTGVVTAQTPSGVTLADVDSDGDLDLLVGDLDNASVAVCINDGTAHFIGSVTGAQNSPVGLRPVGVAAGDVDGDGDLDFVTANNGGNSATVRFNNGTLPLLYTNVSTVAVGVGPTAVALADVDNDGDLDLLTTNAGTGSNPIGTVSLSKNSGTGTFGSATSFAVGLQPSELALADVDGDGDLDLLTADAGGASVSLRLNNGTGTFATLTTLSLPTGSTPTGLRTGDVDSDGDLDLLVAQGTGGRVFTYLNNGTGTFAMQARPLRLNRGTTASAVPSVGVTLGDVDNDGDLDLITSDDRGNVLQSLNLGSAPPLPVPVITGLSPVSGPIGTPVTIAGTALTDVAGVFFNGTSAPGFVLNGTGTAIDVAVPTGTTTGTVTVVTEEAGTATSPTPFTITIPVPVLLTGIVPTRNAASAPRNGSVAATFTVPVTAATAGNLRVFSNLRRGRRAGAITGGGTATLTLAPTPDFAPGELVSVSLPGSLRAADGNQVAKQVVQFTAAVGGTGRHDFITTSTTTVTGASSLRLGDLDNDGDVDVATPGGAQGVQIRLNNGAGTLTNGTPLTSPNFNEPADLLAIGDVDADGDLDIVSTSSAGRALVWLNNGSGGFTNSGVFVAPGYSALNFFALADADADGDLDIVSVGGGLAITVLNNGAGAFATPQNSPLDVTTYDTAIGDVDGDGDLDLVMAARYTNLGYDGIVIKLNNGAGSFVNAPALAVTSNLTRKVALGDLDGDGDLDMALKSTVTAGEVILIRLNDGTGHYGNVTTTLPLAGYSLALGDTDADGDLDVVTYAGVGLNDGSGNFPEVTTATAPGANSNIVALADMDGDLDLDLLNDDQNSSVIVKLNRPGPPPVLTGIAPTSGPVGSRVLLTGNNLKTTATVTFNGVPAVTFSAIANTQLVVTVPVGATSGAVVMTSPAGTATAPTPFTVTQPLATTQVSPARNTANAPRPTTVSVTLARPVSAATAGELRVYSNRRSGPQAGTVTSSGNTLSFVPTQPFAAGEQVSVSITDRLTGTDGSRAERQTFQFTTAANGNGTGLFLPGSSGQSLASYRSRYGFAVGDMDGDGDLDVVSNNGMLRFNNGEGAFPDSTTASYGFFALTDPRNVAVGDLDGDGKPDLLSTNGDLYLNTGNGNFAQQPVLRGFDDDTRDLALGDLDSDGDLDLVAPNYARDSVRVLFNDGTGHFPSRLLVAVGSRPTGISLGDVDNDGDLDFITANSGVSGSSTISVALNNGIGWFPNVQTVAAGTGLVQAALGDLDGDHDLDLVTSNGLVRFNNGTGSFTGSQATPTGTGVTLGDLDSDGDLDLVVSGAGTAAVRRNDGAGQFSGTETVSFGSSSQGHDPVLADLDGDGDLDLLMGETNGSTVRVSLNQRLAAPTLLSFTPASGSVGTKVMVTGTDFIGTTGITFNGTAGIGFTVLTASRLEVMVPAGASSGVLQVTNANGTATSAAAFTVLQSVAVTSGSPAANAVAPLTAPVVVGFSQPIATNTAANLAVFSQQRGGRLAGSRTGAGTSTLTFTPTRPYVAGELLSVSMPAYTTAQSQVQKRVYQFRAAAGGTGRGIVSTTAATQGNGRQTVLGDADGDGDLDAFQVSSQSNAVALQLNDGTGNFAPEVSLLNSGSDVLNLMALGDVDNDGDLDLAVANATRNLVHMRLNNGTGTFTTAPDVPVTDYPQWVSLADFDGDGDLDLLTANSGYVATSISLRYNDGSGNFSGTTNQMLIPSGYLSIGALRVGDLDGDGDLDLVMTISITNTVMLNDGLGHFSAAPRLPFSQDIGSGIELADVDGDGDLDVLGLSWRDPNGQQSGASAWVNVARNTGAGIFQPGGFWVNQYPESLTVGDMDADGDLDLVLTTSGLNLGQTMLNNGQGTFSFLQSFAVPGRPYRPTLGDMDGDGDLDVVTTYPYLSVYFNGPLPLPVITSFTPASGSVGTPVVITGTAFTATTAVRFNGTNAPGFVVNSATRITVNVPTGATTGTISVTTPNGTATSATAFTVAPVITPTQFAPAANAPSVARNAAVSVTFPSAITAASASNMRVFGNQLRGKRPGTLSGGGTATLSLDPAQDFAPGEQISVSLPRTMQTATGALVRPQVYQFTAATGGTGRGGFVPGPTVAMGQYASTLAMGDLDNDGDLDMLTAIEFGQSFSPARIGVRLNNGQGQFSAGTNITTSIYGVAKLALADMDSDGDLDVVIGAGSRGVNVCLNNGNATFGTARFVSLIADQLAVGDMDGDGDLDIVVGDNSNTGLVTIAVNDGQASFTYTAPNYSYYYPITDLVLGDVDGDGDLDAVTANDHYGAKILLNTGTNILTVSTTFSITDYVPSLALADLDNDGDLDLAIGTVDVTNTSWVTTMTNNGTGGFTTYNRVAVENAIRQMALGDVDHDGDLDIVALTNDNTYFLHSVSVRLNNGTGRFLRTASLTMFGSPSQLALGDLDGDGDLDFTVVQSNGVNAYLDERMNDGIALATTAARPIGPQVSLYPNPAHGQFAVLVPVELRPAAARTPLRLYNAVGQLVLEQPWQLSASGELLVDAARLPAGIYTLRLELKDGPASYKIALN